MPNNRYVVTFLFWFHIKIRALFNTFFLSSATGEPKIRTLVLGNNIRLLCRAESNLAQVNWNFAGKPLPDSNRKYTIYSDGLLIYNASANDAGLYTCTSVEQTKGRQYTQTLAIYDLRERLSVDVTDKIKTTLGILTETHTTTSGLHTIEKPPEKPVPNLSSATKWVVMQVALAVISVMMACLLIWNLYMGHISPFMCCGKQPIKSPRNLPGREYMDTGTDAVDSKQPMVRLCVTTNSNIEATSFHRNTSNGDTSTENHISKYITDESEI